MANGTKAKKLKRAKRREDWHSWKHKKARRDFSLRMLFEHKLKKLVVTDSHRVSIKHFGETRKRKKWEKRFTALRHPEFSSVNAIKRLRVPSEGEIHIRYQFLLCWQFFSCPVFYQTSINMCLFEVDKQCTEETWRSEKLCKFSLCLSQSFNFLLCCHVLNGDASDYGVTFYSETLPAVRIDYA